MRSFWRSLQKLALNISRKNTGKKRTGLEEDFLSFLKSASDAYIKKYAYKSTHVYIYNVCMYFLNRHDVCIYLKKNVTQFPVNHDNRHWQLIPLQGNQVANCCVPDSTPRKAA